MNEEIKLNEEISFQEQLNNELTTGMYSALYRKINRNIVIEDKRIYDAFAKFSKLFEMGDSFSPIDLLNCAEIIVNGGEPDSNPTNSIYVYNYSKELPKRMGEKLLRNSYSGIYSLFSINSGVSIDLDAIGGKLAAGETKRFLVMPKKKCQSMIDKCKKYGVEFAEVGEILQSNKIIFTQGGEVIASVDKSLMQNDTNAIKLDASNYPAFISGYRAVCSLVLCDKISQNNLIRLALGGSMADICARVLGYFSAMMFLKPVAARKIMVAGNESTVAVPRPSVTDGDYLYLLKVREDQLGLPDRAHYGQLFYYLVEKKKIGIIKDVLPVRENILGVISRLHNENCSYISISDIPKDCFGVIVTVGRGESINGMKIGYFKNN